jgi:hypothetical protein
MRPMRAYSIARHAVPKVEWMGEKWNGDVRRIEMADPIHPKNQVDKRSKSKFKIKFRDVDLDERKISSNLAVG